MPLGVVACGPADGWDDAGDDEALGALAEPIVNGTTDNGDPAVVALTVQYQMYCSGTLITPNVVLTAAHCLPPHISMYASSYTDIAVFFGTNVGSGDYVSVIAGWTHPGWNDQVIEDDIGLIRLAQAGPPTPIPVNRQSLGGDMGAAVRLVGFGQTSEGNYSSAGVKRQTTGTVDGVHTSYFTIAFDPGGTCSGDSGGTSLMTKGGQEVVAGIHSRSDCVSQSIDTRVDEYQAEIDEFTGAVAPPACESDGQCATGCPAPDPDCPCADDGFCTAACATWTSDPDCDPNCVANGVCVSAGCPVTDPDCLGCGADATCNPSCASDPDCQPCPTDGVCDESCATDPDCWVAGDAPNVKYEGEILGSDCAVATAGAPGRRAWLGWSGGLAAWLLGRRRGPRRPRRR